MLIVDVLLSDGTQGFDRGEKFAHYMPSLEEYVLVAQTEQRVEVLRRPNSGGHWEQVVTTAGQAIVLHGQLIRSR